MEVGQDHRGLEPRKPKSDVGSSLAARDGEWEGAGEVTRAEGDTGEDAGASTLEREKASA